MSFSAIYRNRHTHAQPAQGPPQVRDDVVGVVVKDVGAVPGLAFQIWSKSNSKFRKFDFKNQYD